jgi:prevent-host-death family protein
MRIGITEARKVIHQLLKRCAAEPVIITRRGRPIARLQPFPKTRQESDREMLRKVAEFVPYEFGGLIFDKEK